MLQTNQVSLCFLSKVLFIVLGATFHLESKGGKINKAEKTQIAIVIIVIIITVVLIIHTALIRMKYSLI